MYKKEELEKVYNVINNGGVCIIPTDTVYGISADALNEDAIEKVFFAKKRENKPLLIMVSSIEMLKKYVDIVSPLEEKLISYWPNTLTILLNKNSNISDKLTCGSKKVGVRIPNDKFTLDLINKLNRPIISTSANISGEPVITSIFLLNDELSKNIDYVLDDGEKTNISSTLVNVDNGKVVILREGLLANKIKEKFKNEL